MEVFRDIFRFFKAKTSVEPIVFLSVLSVAIIQVTTVKLYFEKLCKQGSNILGVDETFNDTICENLDLYPEQEELVEARAVELIRISHGIQAGPRIILALFLGSWSDNFKTRKFLLILPTVGFIISPLIYTILASSTDTNADYLLLEVIQDITGGLPIFLLGAYATVCDISTYQTRTTRLAFVEGSFLAGLAAGNAIGNALFTNYSFVPVYILSMVTGLLSLLYLIVIYEEVNNNPDEDKVPYKKQCLDVFKPKHVVETFKTLIPPVEKRHLFVLLLTVYGVLDFIERGEVSVDLAYIKDKFDFDTLSTFESFWNTFYIIYFVWTFLAVVVMVPVLNQIFDVGDAILMLLSAIGSFCRSLIFLMARDPNMLFPVCVLDLFGLAGLLAARSAISKLVGYEYFGKSFAWLSVLQALMDTLSSEYYWIYTSTKDWHAGFIYCLNCTLFIFIVIPVSTFILVQFRQIELARCKEEEILEMDQLAADQPEEPRRVSTYKLEEAEMDIRAIATT